VAAFNKITLLRELGAMQEKMRKVLDYWEARKESPAITTPSSKKTFTKEPLHRKSAPGPPE